jgi:hypothetical protein
MMFVNKIIKDKKKQPNRVVAIFYIDLLKSLVWRMGSADANANADADDAQRARIALGYVVRNASELNKWSSS